MSSGGSGQADGEDDAILAAIRELCTQFAVKFQPRGVSWMGNLGQVLNLPSDQCFFITKGPRRGFVVLPVALKGKLESPKWQLLIAPSLMHQLRSEFRRPILISFAFLIFVLAAPWALIGYALIFDKPILILGSLVLLIAAFLIGPKAFNFYTIRDSRLRADTQVARIFGKDQFVQLLEKIDSMQILDLEERKSKKPSPWRRRVFPWPTIAERLQNLRR